MAREYRTVKTFAHFVTIYAPRAQIWEVLSDLERWPQWTASVDKVQRMDNSVLGVGSRIQIKQPKLAAAQWTITGWKPGKSFTWESRSMGVRITARHRIVEEPSTCKLELRLQLDGWLSPVVSALAGRLMRRYMAMEAAGIKSASEAPLKP